MEKVIPEVVFQVGMVVNDCEEKARELCKYFEIDESTIQIKSTKDMTEAGRITNSMAYGKPKDVFIKTARLSFGGIDFEYVEPLEKEGGDPFSDWLKEHGEGIHHVNVKFANKDVLDKNMKEAGIPVLHSSQWGDKGLEFYDFREKFGFIAEVGEMVVGPMADAYYKDKEK